MNYLFSNSENGVLNIENDYPPENSPINPSYDHNSDILADICLAEDTPINTDQGVIKIQDIDPLINTINEDQIYLISKTKSTNKYLVCFEKNSVANNVPDKKTICSIDHSFIYNKKLIPAKSFTQFF